ncbi:15079_t:CDS:2 [Racocetra fulgida]|uniref:site-specific DNA-methyltransferase (adenine-specific) n=1 Tax=Racocetra fulgida TaxID=60492 RepID=A0A9N9A4D3_9GLOM|nr:15079_t:CDS:2 [Racocetra fulgida]
MPNASNLGDDMQVDMPQTKRARITSQSSGVAESTETDWLNVVLNKQEVDPSCEAWDFYFQDSQVPKHKAPNSDITFATPFVFKPVNPAQGFPTGDLPNSSRRQESLFSSNYPSFSANTLSEDQVGKIVEILGTVLEEREEGQFTRHLSIEKFMKIFDDADNFLLYHSSPVEIEPNNSDLEAFFWYYRRGTGTWIEKLLRGSFQPSNVISYSISQSSIMSSSWSTYPQAPRVLDPCMGIGSFLCEFIHRVTLAARQCPSVWHDPKAISHLLQSLTENIWGIEIDAFAFHLCKLNITIHMLPLYKRFVQLSYPNEIKLPRLHLFCNDTLNLYLPKRELTWEYDNLWLLRSPQRLKFDYIVTNPPYMIRKTGFISEPDSELFDERVLGKGGMQAYAYFFWFCVERCREEAGEICLISGKPPITSEPPTIFLRYMNRKATLQETLKAYANFNPNNTPFDKDMHCKITPPYPHTILPSPTRPNTNPVYALVVRTSWAYSKFGKEVCRQAEFWQKMGDELRLEKKESSPAEAYVPFLSYNSCGSTISKDGLEQEKSMYSLIMVDRDAVDKVRKDFGETSEFWIYLKEARKYLQTSMTSREVAYCGTSKCG